MRILAQLGSRGWAIWFIGVATPSNAPGTCPWVVFMMPNVRAKRATTAWRAGQQAQNGPQAQRLLACATCRWRAA